MWQNKQKISASATNKHHNELLRPQVREIELVGHPRANIDQHSRLLYRSRCTEHEQNVPAMVLHLTRWLPVEETLYAWLQIGSKSGAKTRCRLNFVAITINGFNCCFCFFFLIWRFPIMVHGVQTAIASHPEGADGRVKRPSWSSVARQFLAQWQNVCYLLQGRICFGLCAVQFKNEHKIMRIDHFRCGIRRILPR